MEGTRLGSIARGVALFLGTFSLLDILGEPVRDPLKQTPNYMLREIAALITCARWRRAARNLDAIRRSVTMTP